MYRKLLASTALSLAMVGGVFAQDEMAPAPADPAAEAPAGGAQAPAEPPQEPLVEAEETGINADGWLATEIIGSEIFTSSGEEGESIGSVNDFVFGADGQIAAVIVGVGGFLGIGEKNVAIGWSDLELGTDVNGEQRLISSMTREQLENAEDFNREEWLASEQGGDALLAPEGDGAMAPEGEAGAEAEGGAMAPEGGDAMAPAEGEGGAMAPEGGDAMAPAEGEGGAMAPEGEAGAEAEGGAMAPEGEAGAEAEGEAETTQ